MKKELFEILNWTETEKLGDIHGTLYEGKDVLRPYEGKDVVLRPVKEWRKMSEEKPEEGRDIITTFYSSNEERWLVSEPWEYKEEFYGINRSTHWQYYTPPEEKDECLEAFEEFWKKLEERHATQTRTKEEAYEMWKEIYGRIISMKHKEGK